MNTLVRILTLVPILLVGCQATHDVASTSYHVTRGAAVGSYKVARAVAVGSYRVASAPVHYVTGKRGDESTIVRTETPSDVTNPGQPIPPSEMASASQTRKALSAELTDASSRALPWERKNTRICPRSSCRTPGGSGSSRRGKDTRPS